MPICPSHTPKQCWHISTRCSKTKCHKLKVVFIDTVLVFIIMWMLWIKLFFGLNFFPNKVSLYQTSVFNFFLTKSNFSSLRHCGSEWFVLITCWKRGFNFFSVCFKNWAWNFGGLQRMSKKYLVLQSLFPSPTLPLSNTWPLTLLPRSTTHYHLTHLPVTDYHILIISSASNIIRK